MYKYVYIQGHTTDNLEYEQIASYMNGSLSQFRKDDRAYTLFSSIYGNEAKGTKGYYYVIFST